MKTVIVSTQLRVKSNNLAISNTFEASHDRNYEFNGADAEKQAMALASHIKDAGSMTLVVKKELK